MKGSTNTTIEKEKGGPSAKVVIPFSLVLGVDYNMLTTGLEIGGRYNTSNYTTFALGLNVGTKF